MVGEFWDRVPELRRPCPSVALEFSAGIANSMDFIIRKRKKGKGEKGVQDNIASALS